MRVTFNGRDLTKLHTRLELLSDEEKAKIKRIIQDTGAKLHEQRSETMGTYSLPEALTLAKTKPGQLFKDKDGREVIFDDNDALKGWEYLYANGKKTFIRDTNLWYEEQPKIQKGDWVQLDGEYAQVTGSEDTNNFSLHFLNTSQGYMGNHGTYLRNQLEKVTDERAQIFLNGGRLPGQWKAGDIFQTGKRQPLRVVPQVYSSERMEVWGATPVCFVEDRKDRGDTP